MLYINIAKERKLIGIRRSKQWVEPRQEVDLDTVDIRMLGVNGASMMLKTKFDEIKRINKKRRKKAKARKAAKLILAATKKAKVKAKAKAKKAKIKAKAKAKKAKAKKAPIKKAIAKIVKKVKKKIARKPKALTSAQLKAQKAALKEAISKKNKSDLVAFGEEVLKIDVKLKDKKDTIINKILNASKKAGYTKVLKKA